MYLASRRYIVLPSVAVKQSLKTIFLFSLTSKLRQLVKSSSDLFCFQNIVSLNMSEIFLLLRTLHLKTYNFVILVFFVSLGLKKPCFVRFFYLNCLSERKIDLLTLDNSDEKCRISIAHFLGQPNQFPGNVRKFLQLS